MKKINVISFIGNVGSGKSTIASELNKTINGVLLLEGPEEFRFLEEAFLKPQRWSFHNQLDFLLLKHKQVIKNIEKSQLAVQEMDLFATHKIWTPVLKELNCITSKEEEFLNDLYLLIKGCQESNIQLQTVYVYIKCSKEKIINRIEKRGRNFEKINNQMKKLISALQARIEVFVDTEKLPHYIFDNDLDDINEALEKNAALIPAIIRGFKK